MRAVAPDVTGWRERTLAQLGATWLLIGLTCRLPVLIALPEPVSWLLDLEICATTWLFTWRLDTDTRAVRALGWLLRVFVVLDVVAMASTALGEEYSITMRVMLGALLLPLLGVSFCIARLNSLGLAPLRQGYKAVLGIGAVLVVGALAANVTLWGGVLFALGLTLAYVAFMVCAYWFLVRTRHALSVVLCEWWLDVASLPQVIWVHYALLGDGRVELRTPEQPVRWFENYAAAVFWLSDKGYLPEDTAVKRGLASPRHGSELTVRGWRALLRRG